MISAPVHNSRDRHHVTLRTGEAVNSLAIPPKPTGFGSSANGGELLFLALAICYCNDLYREAEERGLEVRQVVVVGDFAAEGEPAQNVTYHVRAAAAASEEAVRELVSHTDRVAEIQNTLRVGTSVTLGSAEIVEL